MVGYKSTKYIPTPLFGKTAAPAEQQTYFTLSLLWDAEGDLGVFFVACDSELD